MWANACACCRAKYVIPLLVATTAIVTFFLLDLVAEFKPRITDFLPMTNDNATELYAIIVPPGLSGDFASQMMPLEVLLESMHGDDDNDSPNNNGNDVNAQFQEATMAAADNFVSNASDVSVASPVQCSFQLYKVDGPPVQEDMWTARGVLVHAANFTEAQRLAVELSRQQEGSELPFPPLHAIRFGPGPYVHGSHPLSESFVFSLLSTYWVESLIGLHWDTFGFQDKFVVLRIEVMTKNAKEDVNVRQHVIMKPDSLDLYEIIYPN